MPRILSRLLTGLLVGGLIVIPPLALTLRAQQAVRYYMCGACLGSGKLKEWKVDTCPQCGGDGLVGVQCSRCLGNGTLARTCGRCGGDGAVWFIRRFGPYGQVIERTLVTCPRCNGSGVVYRRCATCGGDGVIQVRCTRCNGRGEYGYWTWRYCPYCKGTGYYAYVPVVDSHRQ